MDRPPSAAKDKKHFSFNERPYAFAATNSGPLRQIAELFGTVDRPRARAASGAAQSPLPAAIRPAIARRATVRHLTARGPG